MGGACHIGKDRHHQHTSARCTQRDLHVTSGPLHIAIAMRGPWWQRTWCASAAAGEDRGGEGCWFVHGGFIPSQPGGSPYIQLPKAQRLPTRHQTSWRVRMCTASAGYCHLTGPLQLVLYENAACVPAALEDCFAVPAHGVALQCLRGDAVSCSGALCLDFPCADEGCALEPQIIQTFSAQVCAACVGLQSFQFARNAVAVRFRLDAHSMLTLRLICVASSQQQRVKRFSCSDHASH